MQLKRLSSLLAIGAVGMTLGCAQQPNTVNTTLGQDGSFAIQQAEAQEEVDPDQMTGAIEEPAEEMETQSFSLQQRVVVRRTWARGHWGPNGRWVGGGWAGNRWYGRRHWRNTWWDPHNVRGRIVYRPIRPVPPIATVRPPVRPPVRPVPPIAPLPGRG